MMRRREFITLIGGAASGWPLAARAQQIDRVRRIGVLMSVANDADQQAYLASFLQTLRQLGWTEGRNVVIDIRWSDGDRERIKADARALVESQPDAVLAQSTPATTALRSATQKVPIVFTQVSDPIGRGFTASLARPGGNVTGFINFESSMGGKWLEVLKEVAPTIARVGCIFNPLTSSHIAGGFYLRPLENAGHRSAVKPIIAPVQIPADVERTIDDLALEPDTGVVVLPDAFTAVHRNLIVELIAQRRLPAIYAFRFYVTSGGLLSYGINPGGQYPRAGAYVDRILRGAKPADLPVQAPIKFELVVNLKTARALGLTVPDTLLARADEVIE
jgi:putative tryptophan/tyrosine transport system substrate-binding protein